MKYKIRIIVCLFLLFFFQRMDVATAQKKRSANEEIGKMVHKDLVEAVKQYHFLMKNVPPDSLPRTYQDGRVFSVTPYAWISGFYPGALLYLYQYSGDTSLSNQAIERLKSLEKIKTVTSSHDLGFMMYNSFGNAYRLFHDPHYKDVLIQSAKSLATRFNPKVGCIKSWNKVKSLDGKRTLYFPVIIDNMMNLELLFFASKATGDPYYKNIAIQHANTTLKNHFRPDFSSYHVVDYDSVTGKVKSKETEQGFSDNSTWARGQAWAIYGFTMMYRETKDPKYLTAVQKMADYFINNPNLPKDKIPYWDFNVNQPGYTPLWNYDPNKYPVVPRDASAAAIAASALIELSGYVDKNTGKKYLQTAELILKSLSSPKYKAAVGANGGFILMHSCGGVPGDAEVDVPLIYADYYYIEALTRLHAIVKQ